MLLLWTFVEAAERAIRLGACARASFMFLNNQDSAHAFCDYLTIANTCILNKVSINDYLLWLVANIKLRIHQRAQKNQGTPIDFTMPNKIQKSYSIVNDKGKVEEKVGTIGMYHKDNHFSYDKIDVSDLTPYEFAKLLKD